MPDIPPMPAPPPGDGWAEATSKQVPVYKAHILGQPAKPRLCVVEADFKMKGRLLYMLVELARLQAGPDELPVVALYTAGERHTLMLVDARDLRLYFD